MTEAELKKLRPPSPPVRVRVRLTDDPQRVTLTGRDSFELRGAAVSTWAAMRPCLEVQVDDHRARVELAPGMSARDAVSALARTLPGDYVLRARELKDGLCVNVVRAADAWRPWR